MILTKQKDIEEILKSISEFQRILLVGCGSCATQCKTGGEEQIERLKQLLEERGKIITGMLVPDETCHIPLVKRILRENKTAVDESECILSFSCGAGVSAIREVVDRKVIPGVDTIALVVTKRKGSFEGRCSLCGDCILGITEGLCPVTLCPKGIMNGPCGGMDRGRCEIYPEEDCVWVRIYNISSKKDIITEIKGPKDFSRTLRAERIDVGR